MLELAILGLLKERPMHGYQLSRELGESLGGFWRVSYGSLYPSLRRLEKEGAVESVPSDEERGGRRKNVYRVTEKGEKLFFEMLQETPHDNSTEDTRFRVRLAFFKYLPPETRIRLLERRRALLEDRLSTIKDSLRATRERVDDYTLALMDRYGIEKAQIGVSREAVVAQKALRDHPDRFFGSANSDPNKGMEGVREIVHLHERFGIKSVSAFPCGNFPQVPIGAKEWYPIFAKCVELDLPFNCCVGVPGPRIPMAPQHVEQIDEICWFFPELRFVMRHGAEPWTALAVKLMLKWPNLYYSTSAFAPKHYPKDILDFANTRGADKVMYASDYPHWDSDFPHTVAPIRDRTDLSDDAKERILGGTAAAFYRL